MQNRFLPKIKCKHDDINVRLAEEQFCMMKLFTTVKLTWHHIHFFTIRIAETIYCFLPSCQSNIQKSILFAQAFLLTCMQHLTDQDSEKGEAYDLSATLPLFSLLSLLLSTSLSQPPHLRDKLESFWPHGLAARPPTLVSRPHLGSPTKGLPRGASSFIP
jgi:hypothetical protein